jgi:hypothetical protein
LRLIAWNANAGSRTRRTFEGNLEILSPLLPDIVVLSESRAPRDGEGWAWQGGASSPCLAVWVAPGYRCDEITSDGPGLTQAGLLAIGGPIAFTLAAVWPVTAKGLPSYSRTLMQCLDSYSVALQRGPAIMAGDFNSGTTVLAPRSSHPKFVKRAHELGMVSAYHFHEGIAHGEERVGTLLRGKTAPKEFHIDYCFTSADLADAAVVTILRGDRWLRRSDHLPLVLDVPNAAFSSRAP